MFEKGSPMGTEDLVSKGYDIPPEIQGQVTVTTLDKIYNWSRERSIWPMMFGLACCAIEMIAAAASRYDIARMGMEVMRPSPRQSDLMIVSGTVTKKMIPQIVRLYNQMPEPKYVLAMGLALLAADLSKRAIPSCLAWINLCPSMFIFRAARRPRRL